jgi:hypothetical protein
MNPSILTRVARTFGFSFAFDPEGNSWKWDPARRSRCASRRRRWFKSVGNCRPLPYPVLSVTRSPWGRAKAPATGVPPEWEDWDRKTVIAGMLLILYVINISVLRQTAEPFIMKALDSVVDDLVKQ